MSRFVIRNPAGLFYSGNLVAETVWVPRAGDPSRTDPVSKLAPQFESVQPFGAVKYESAEDAAAMLAHPDLADAKAFDGCAVFEAEFDRHDPNAVRAVS